MNKYQVSIARGNEKPISTITYANSINDFRESVKGLIRDGFQVEIHQLVPVYTDWAQEVAQEVAA